MSSPENISPVNPLPPVVVALFVLVAGIEIVMWLGSQGIVGGADGAAWRISAVQKYAFSGEIADWMVRNNSYPPEHLIRFFTYGFIHFSFPQAIFVCVFLLALGKSVGESFGGVATLIVFIGSGVGGAVVYWLLLNDSLPLVGGFPHVYGLIGAFTYLMWLRLGQMGESQVRAFSLIGALMGIQLLFGALFGSQPDWVADVGGFATGFLLSFLVSPGGWARLRQMMRHD
ncbi:MAG: rhomboid family intramembrane serine protease [Paracoccaceae bacterium]|nr:rhomboid family intramembrane serine protease [Paracoccaceae bacterium]MDG1737576.1 rhomboid family intramembrane serine protease [Paracoccaceae bacterium]MDG2257504.1 rhomboid family intramembrane serine protease [Paracoccaceae bacterium]